MFSDDVWPRHNPSITNVSTIIEQKLLRHIEITIIFSLAGEFFSLPSWKVASPSPIFNDGNK